MLKIDLVSEFSEFEKLEVEWNKLVRSEPSEEMVFLAHEWFDCWWKSFSKDTRLHTIVVKDNNKIVGIAPLMMKKTLIRGLPVKLLSFIDNGNSGHNNFIVDTTRRSEILEKIIECLVDKMPVWDLLELKRIPPKSLNFQILREVLHSKRILFAEKEGTYAPYLRIGSDWDSFFKSKSRKTRKTIRNIQNRLDKRGSYFVQKITDFEGYKEVKSKLYEISANSWAEEKGNSLNNPENRLFFDKVSYFAALRGWLLIWILHLNEEPIAFEYHLKYKGKVHGLRSYYKQSYSDVSPGAFLNYYIIQHLFEDSTIYEYDMGGGADFYKLRWTKDYRRHITFHIFTKKFYSKLIYICEHKVIPIIKWTIQRIK